MTTQGMIVDFGALADQEKREVLSRRIRMARHIDDPAASDDELLSTADEVFLEYDRREAAE